LNNYEALETYAQKHLMHVRVLDDLMMEDSYVFVALAYLRAIDLLARESDTEAEIYKVDRCPETGIPTLHTSFLGAVDEAKFDEIADRIWFELTCVSIKKT